MATKTYNFLKSNSFVFSITRLPETSFRVTGVEMPGVEVPAAQAGYPGSTQYFPGSFTEYSELTIRFIVDEDLKNYQEILEWCLQQRFAIGGEYTPISAASEKLVSDGFLTTLTNSSNPNRVFYFKDMFPTSVSGWSFDTTQSDVTSISCNVTFRYSYFQLR